MGREKLPAGLAGFAAAFAVSRPGSVNFTTERDWVAAVEEWENGVLHAARVAARLDRAVSPGDFAKACGLHEPVSETLARRAGLRLAA